VSDTLIVALIQNAGLLLAMVVFFELLTARQQLFATPLRRVVTGLVIGLIGIAMIEVSVQLEAGIIFDTRSVLLAVSGLFLGFWPTFIAMVMTAAFRVYHGGQAAWTGVAVILASGAIGIVWRRLWRRPLEEVSWQYLYALGLVVHLVMLALMFTLSWETALSVVRAVGVPVMVVHPLATVALGVMFAQRLRYHSATAELSKRETRLRLALKAAKQGLYDLNVQTGEATVSDEYARMLGYDPAGFRETNDAWMERMHPDDREPMAEAYRDYIAGRIPEYRVKFRQRTQSGEWVWMLSLGSLVSWDAEGKPLHMMGTRTDITALTIAEQQAHDAETEMARLLAVAEQSRRALLSLVEDQQAAERKLLAAHQLAQSTLDALKDNICVLDEDGAIIAVNNAWREFGVANGARAEAILAGANYLAVCDQTIGPEEEQARKVAAALRAVLGGVRGTFSMEYPCDSPQVQRWFQLWVTRFAGGGSVRVVVAHENITDRKDAENNLRRLTQILGASQSAARVGGWELDLIQKSLFWTEETYRIHDTSPSEYTPTLATAISFFTPESISALEEVLQEATDHGTARDVDLELITLTGRRKWVHFTPSITAERGRTVRITCAIQDITARKWAERERLEMTARLQQAQKLESIGSLAGGVAHDINNVLAAILSSATAHRRQLDDSDPLARSLDTIINACVRGRSVVRSLLYFARRDIETRGPVDLNGIAREIVQLLDKTTLQRIRFTTDLEEPLAFLDGDAGAISHAVMNLCVNSLDAMPDGGAVTIRTRTRSDGLIEISVRDAGTGMTPEVREKSIEPFFTTKPFGKGTGLGLAMVYGTVKAHKGTFEIIAAPGQGTEVILGFPANPVGVEPQAPPATIPAEKKTVSAGTLRILLVDDDELIRDGVGSLLELEGHEVHLAEGGAEALARFESGLEVDLVMLDLNMPGLTGAETLLRLLTLRPEQVVLLCSGHGDEEMARLMTGRPTVDSIQKPFTLDELEGKLSAMGLRAEGRANIPYGVDPAA
jgi:PAS domain S-box-containing protein